MEVLSYELFMTSTYSLLQISQDGLSMSLETSDSQKIGARFPHPYVSYKWSIHVLYLTRRSVTTFTHFPVLLSTPYLSSYSTTHWTLMWSWLLRWKETAHSASREWSILVQTLVSNVTVYY